MSEDPFYLDTSALLPYYRPEATSEAVDAFLRGVDVLLIEHAYLDDLREGRFELSAVPTRSFTRAREWLFLRKVELRTLDALHLAACAEEAAVMVTCDRELHQAANEAGVDSRLIE